MANRIVSVPAGIYGMGIYAIMLPSSGFSVAHCTINGTQSKVKYQRYRIYLTYSSVIYVRMKCTREI